MTEKENVQILRPGRCVLTVGEWGGSPSAQVTSWAPHRTPPHRLPGNDSPEGQRDWLYPIVKSMLGWEVLRGSWSISFRELWAGKKKVEEKS